MSRLTDTSAEADRVLTEIYRRMSPGDKWLRLGHTYRDARLLHAAGVRLRNPAATRLDIHASWLALHCGLTSPEFLKEPLMDQPLSTLNELRAFITVLERLGIAYALGGSMASSIHGVDRFTRDADLTVEPFPGREAELAGSFGPDYYVNLSSIEEAVRSRSSFNIIHTPTGFKIDVFVRKDEPFETSAMKRRISLSLPDKPEQPIVLHSPEDVILLKLRWYRHGNETSEQQWKDLLGVIKTQSNRLDQQYLDKWAAHLGVHDLLARARQESAV